MPFWHHKSPAEHEQEVERKHLDARAQQALEQAQRRADADRKLLAHGEIPALARQRLVALAKQTDTFTSNLSPDEVALIRRGGYRPLGMVGGSAMYHVGAVRHSSVRDGEVKILSRAYDEATALAARRMQQEAALLGAHGVVGVRFAMRRHPWGEGTVEVTVLGTGVAGPGETPKTLWLSDLSGQEWWALHRAGYVPTGLAFGHCSWFMLTRAADEAMDDTPNNREYTHFSRALKRCRDIGAGKLQEMARVAESSGVVGVHLLRHREEVSEEEVELTGRKKGEAKRRAHHLLTFSVVGTAVRLRTDAPETVPATRTVLSLRGGRLVSTTAVTAPSTEG
jgi:uncharacterized protein YbjQ (UPF0145 family)